MLHHSVYSQRICACACVCARAGFVRGQPAVLWLEQSRPQCLFTQNRSLTQIISRCGPFLIPTQSQWSQVELATAAIRYSNTASWSASHGLSFPHPLSPLFPLFAIPNVTRILKFTETDHTAKCFASSFLAGQFLFFIFYSLSSLSDSCSTTFKSKQAAVVWKRKRQKKTPTRLQRNAYLK